jgi:hypothetical protein
MNTQRLQGLALILSALTGVLLLLPFMKYLGYMFSNLIEVISVISAILFLVGISAIKSIQPQTKKSWGFRMRKWWLAGLVLMTIPTIGKIISNLNSIINNDPGIPNGLAESSIWRVLIFPVVAYSGYVLTGWLTTQTRVFPVWIGWVLMITGVCYASLWLFIIYLPANWLPPVINTGPWTALGTLLESAALAGYGWTIFNYQTLYSGQRAKAPRQL